MSEYDDSGPPSFRIGSPWRVQDPKRTADGRLRAPARAEEKRAEPHLSSRRATRTMWSRTLGLGSALRRSRVATAGALGGQPAASQRALSAASAGRLAHVGAGAGVPRSWSVRALASRDGVPLFWATPSHEWRRYSSSGHQAKSGANALPAGATGAKAADEDADAEDQFLTKIVEPTYPTPKPRTDINKVYFPGKAFRSTSRDVVFRAMAGNTAIMLLKVAAWLKTGSSAMLSEAIHSLVDTGNQALLILGLRQASGVPDKKHQYGYGRAAYFWSLISALGIFWLGAGVTVAHGIQTIFYPPKELTLSWEVWSVLGCSFLIDGWVLKRSVQELLAMKPKGKSFFQHLAHTKDPFMMAVLLEDSAACTGVIIAACGIGASHVTGNPLWDSLASISIGVLLGGVAVTLIRLNQKYLLGQSVEPEIEQGIRELLLSRPSIDNVYAVQSQWVGPSTFSYKAEVDFDGTYLAAKLLQMYKPVFLETTNLEQELPLILASYAEDVTRLVEKEVQEVEEEIRTFYPEAAFIELEPDSKESEMRAISSMRIKSYRTSEKEAMTRALALLARTLERKKPAGSPTDAVRE